MSKIIGILGRQILDSRGNPTVEVECESIESIHNHSAWAYKSEG